MNDIWISSIPALVMWAISALIFLWIKHVQKRATSNVIGEVIDNQAYRSGDVHGNVSIVEYVIDGQTHQKEFQINQLIRFHGIPIGQQKGLPIGSKVELAYNPKNSQQIYAVLDNQFGKRLTLLIFSLVAVFLSLFPMLFLLKEVGLI